MRLTNVSQTVPLAGAFLVGNAIPSLAEVCDKVVGSSWKAEHGVVWLFNPLLGEQSGIVTILAALTFLGVMFSRRLGYMAAAVFAALAIWQAVTVDWSAFRHAVDEGCLSTPTLGASVALLVLLACGSIWARSALPGEPAGQIKIRSSGDGDA